MYDTQKERFWFPVPNQTGIKIGLNHGYFGDNSYTDVVYHTANREDWTAGYVIPTHLLRDLKVSGNRPSHQIRQLMFELVPKYSGLENEIERYGITHSPIQALEEKRGDCVGRTSVGAAIARVNNVPYRIVASQNLAPDIKTRKDAMVTFLGSYNIGRLQRITMPRYSIFPPTDMFRLPYPHKWLEVYEDGQWITVDTVEWTPTTFFPFIDKAKKRFVCTELSLDELVSEPSPK